MRGITYDESTMINLKIKRINEPFNLLCVAAFHLNERSSGGGLQFGLLTYTLVNEGLKA